MEALGEPNPNARHATDDGAYDRKGFRRLPLAIREDVVGIDHASRGDMCPTGQRRLFRTRRGIVPNAIQGFVSSCLLGEGNVFTPRDTQQS